MLRAVLITLGILATVTVLTGVYLAPDDLAQCKAPTAEGMCKKADAIVAVSGGNTSVRTAEAIRLYKAGWADYLVFSGAAADPAAPSNAAVMKKQAIQEGVPEQAIVTEEFSRTTKENAEETKQKSVEYGFKRLIVVTSPYHQRRAGLEFARLVGGNTEIINHPAPNDPDWPAWWWLTPRGWWLAGSELLKISVTHTEETK